MNDLLKLAIEAHGGLEQWNKFSKIKIRQHVGGVLWQAKGQDDVLTDSIVEVNLREQRTSYIDFEKPGQHTAFTPDRVALVDDAKVVDELLDPRDSFKDHVFATPWSKLQLAYFGSYAMWGYLTAPFSFTLPGFVTKEIEPWQEAGETWRRLQVTFPDNFAYHTKEQVFYFDENGLLKRNDYTVDINENVPAAHYTFDYKEFQGLRLPTRRLVYARDAEGHYMPEPLVVKVELRDVQFS